VRRIGALYELPPYISLDLPWSPPYLPTSPLARCGASARCTSCRSRATTPKAAPATRRCSRSSTMV